MSSDSHTPYTDRYYGGSDLAREAHKRLDKQQAALDALVKEVSGMRSEMKEMLNRALIDHEGREALVRINPDALAKKISEEVTQTMWTDVMGADLTSGPDSARNKRALQDAARAIVKSAPYLFGWKMRILMMFGLASLALVGGALVPAAKSILGMNP